MTIPIIYRKAGPSTSNYNFYDVMSGTGYVEFIGGMAGATYILSNAEYYSEWLTTTGDLTGHAASTKVIDVDFDVLINKATTLQGIGILNIPYLVTADGAVTVNAYVKAKIRKVPSGGAEAEIATSSSSRSITDDAGGTTYAIGGCSVVIPSTTFKPGDTLRVTIEGYGDTTAGNSFMRIAHDPKDRKSGYDYTSTGAVSWGATDPTILMFQCPIRV